MESNIENEQDILTFLSNTVLNYSHIPENYYYKLEMEVLDISHNESIKGMDKKKSKFLIGMFIIFRILISEILYKPHSWYKGDKLSQKSETLLKQLGCYFLHITNFCLWENITEEFLYRKKTFHKEMDDLLNDSGDDGFGNFRDLPELVYRGKFFLPKLT